MTTRILGIPANRQYNTSMKFNHNSHFATWNRRDYRNRLVVGVYSREALDWLVTQDSTNIEIYGPPHAEITRNLAVIVVGVPEQLYTLFTLKFS